MAANMQHMAGAGQPMGQQMRRPNGQPHGVPQGMQHYVFQNIMQNGTPLDPTSWQSTVQAPERVGKVMNLISNIALAGGVTGPQAANFGCQFEREQFLNSPNKATWETNMSNKTMEFFKKRQENSNGLQAGLNANAQVQMAMQANMGAGMGMGRGQVPQQAYQQFANGLPQQMLQQTQQPTQQMQHAQMQQQQAQPNLQAQQQQQMAFGMNMGMNMMNQAGRGMSPAQRQQLQLQQQQQQQQQQQRLAMAAGHNVQQQPQQPQQIMLNNMAGLTQIQRNKVADLGRKLMAQQPEQAKATTRDQLMKMVPPGQLAEFAAQGKDPLAVYFENQALAMLKSSQQQAGMAQNAGGPQAALMQQQQSQQRAMQHRQNPMNATQQAAAVNDFSQFNPSMESIKDQQLSGLMAQQAGQMVVPASNAQNRNGTPQPMNQGRPNQQGQGQMGRPPPQNQQQPNQGQQSAQQQQQQQFQQMKMNQAAQQSQAQLQAQQQAKQMQGQQALMANGLQPGQSPALNTLNTPAAASRQPGNMNPMMGQGPGQGVAQFGGQRFNQGGQRANPQWAEIMQTMSSDDQKKLQQLPPDAAREIMMKWQNSRNNDHMARQQNDMNNPNLANRQAPQFNTGMAGGPTTGPMQQQANMTGQQTAQMRMVALADNLIVPQPLLDKIPEVPEAVKRWKELKAWVSQAGRQDLLKPLMNYQQQQFTSYVNQQKARAQQAQQQPQQAQVPTPQQPQQGQGQQPHQQATQTANMSLGMQANPIQMQSQQQAFQQQEQQQQQQQQAQSQQMPAQRPQPPASYLQVTPAEIAHVRNQRQEFASLPDDKMTQIVLSMKQQQWNKRMQAQAAGAQNQLAQRQNQQGPTPGNANANAMSAMQFMQQQQQQLSAAQNATQAQVQNQALLNQPGKAAAAPAAPQKQATTATNRKAQGPKPSPAQGTKNLKRPSTDQGVDSGDTQKSSGIQGKPSAPTQASEAALQHFQMIVQRMKMAGLQPFNGQPLDVVRTFYRISNEVDGQVAQEVRPEVLSAQESPAVINRILHYIGEMNKMEQPLMRYFYVTGDSETRLRDFFRARARFKHQFNDRKTPTIANVKPRLTVSSDELDQTRALLVDISTSIQSSKATTAPQNQNAGITAQQIQQQQHQLQLRQQAQQQAQQAQQKGSGAAPNAATSEKNNAQTTEKKIGKAPGKNAKGSQPPAAPTTAQPPFAFGASSPHGNPNYIGKARDMQLQLPAARKKQKTQPGQTPGSATASPMVGKGQSPEARRTHEPAMPTKPMFTCQEPDCESPYGYTTEQALQEHVQEDHLKPKEDPAKFAREQLSLALGLEADGSEPRQADSAPTMATTMSRQGLTPGTLAATPKSQETAMKRSASSMSKGGDAKKLGATPKPGEVKMPETPPQATKDPWTSSKLSPNALTHIAYKLGYYKVFLNPNLPLPLSMSNKTTPDSVDGLADPTMDGTGDNDDKKRIDWMDIDTGMLLNIDDATFAANDGMVDYRGQKVDILDLYADKEDMIDWSDAEEALKKPFKFDTSKYFLDTT